MRPSEAKQVHTHHPSTMEVIKRLDFSKVHNLAESDDLFPFVRFSFQGWQQNLKKRAEKSLGLDVGKR